MSPSLVATGMGMRFGGITALDNTHIAVGPGRIVGLIGRNGSGKSTLFNCITGFLTPTAGRVEVGGLDITGCSPDRIVAAGVARTFQTPRVEMRVTVGEAVLCGLYPHVRSGILATLAGLAGPFREERELRDRADAVLDRLGLLAFKAVEIGKLSMGRVRLVEVARCIAAGSRFILLDEPAAGLTGEEQVVLAGQIRRVAADGIGVLLVEHNFDLIRDLCEEVTVLETGRVLCSGPPRDVARDARVIATYLGTGAEAGTEAAP